MCEDNKTQMIRTIRESNGMRGISQRDSFTGIQRDMSGYVPAGISDDRFDERAITYQECDDIIRDAMEMRVGFITAGDTMSATTHVDLRIQAAEAGIPVRVFHGISIFSACPTSLGLQHYKFGRTVTLPFLEENYHPKSPYDHIKENKDRGLHTMILLDIRADELRYMTAHQAIEWLIEGENKWGEGLIDDRTLLCVASKVGSPEERIFAGYPQDLLKMDVGEPLQTLVLPGKLHFMEQYALVKFAGAPEEIIEDE